MRGSRERKSDKRVSAVKAVFPFKGRLWGWIKRKLLQVLYPSLPWIKFGKFHGAYVDIPQGHQHKLVVAAKRDPLAYYVSCYLHGRKGGGSEVFQWQKHYREKREQEHLSTKGNSFPDFGEFLRFYNEAFPSITFFRWSRGATMRCHIGFITFVYIWFLFKDPVEVLTKTDDELREYFESQQWKQGICSVHFLRTEHLNRDLHDFLLKKMSLSRTKLLFVLAARKVGARKHRFESGYSEELVNYIKEKDQIYYRYFYEPTDLGPHSGNGESEIRPTP